MSIRDQFISILTKNFEALTSDQIGPLVHENLLSPFQIQLPSKVLEQAQDFAKAIWKLRTSDSYIRALEEDFKNLNLKHSGHHSILTSYDFHYMPETESLKLIEINTNAAFWILGHFMNQAHEVPGFQVEKLKSDIFAELTLFGRSVSNPRIAIIDEKPETQRLFIEFLTYQALFKSWGFETDILDISQISPEYDFIYNRHTDFYLTEPLSSTLRNWYNSKQICLSPNPEEYFYLADKQRMNLWNSNSFFEQMGLPTHDIAEIKKVLAFSCELHTGNKSQIWEQRKNLFFKPMNSFGSKQTYRGAKISKKTFDEMNHFIAQEFIPAPEVVFETPTGPQSFKYDLRFYVYQDCIEGAVARIYQGQVTNLKTPYGGFAPVIFKSFPNSN